MINQHRPKKYGEKGEKTILEATGEWAIAGEHEVRIRGALMERDMPASGKTAPFPLLNSRRRLLHGRLYKNSESKKRKYLQSHFAGQAAEIDRKSLESDRLGVHPGSAAVCLTIFDTLTSLHLRKGNNDPLRVTLKMK